MERTSIIQQLGIKTFKIFGHHPWQHTKKRKSSSSSAAPVHFEACPPHEHSGNMSESDVVNASGPFQDASQSDVLLFVEASSIVSDLPQSQTNVKVESESIHTPSEDIDSTKDHLLDDNTGSYSENAQNQAGNASISSRRQFEPVCKFHRLAAFHDEMALQNLVEDLACPEKLELQSRSKDTNVKQDSLKEENPMQTGFSANKDHFAHERARKCRSPSLNRYRGERLQFIERSLAKSTAGDSALNPSQPQSFLYKEITCKNGKNAFHNESSFDIHDLRVTYKTEEPEISSKEVQTSRDITETSVSQQEEVTEEEVESLAITLSWSPAGENHKACAENGMTPDMKHSLENLQPLQEDMALSEDLWRLRHTNKKQKRQLQDFQSKNLYLENKVKELQVQVTKQQMFIDIINKLKENVEELIDEKYNIILEKNDVNKKYQDLQETLANTQKSLQESKKEKETLQLQVKKTNVSFVHLQERYITEVQEKNTSVNQCVEMEKTLSKKEEEIESLQELKKKLEKATAGALDLLRTEKAIREEALLSSQEEFQKHEKENLKERRKLKLRVEKLVTQVKSLLLTCEDERAKNTKLQQQIEELRKENVELLQQVAKSTEQKPVPYFKVTQVKEQVDEMTEPDVTQGIKMTHSDLFLSCSSCKESPDPPSMKKTPLARKIHSLLTLVVGLLTCQDITSPDAEHCQERKQANDIMLQKLKSIQLKKKDLDKELLKHKNRISTLKELIASEKAFQDYTIEVKHFDTEEAMNVTDTPILFAVKLDKYHSLNEELDLLITRLGNILESKEDHCSRLIEENDKYRRHVGNLINKVTSYEEIIKCADQRLEISHSQIAHLEERNRHLEDLIRMPRVRKPGKLPQEIHFMTPICPVGLRSKKGNEWERRGRNSFESIMTQEYDQD